VDPLAPHQIQDSLAFVGVTSLPAGAGDQFAQYLELLLRWNRRLNLTAIRDPEQIIRRHFAESAFAAGQIPSEVRSLLDFGSGAGFPGIPIAICRPEIQVTLAEAHGKKASFLREAVRVLGLKAEVYAGRVETIQEERQFDAVAMRAVEKMDKAIPIASQRAQKYLIVFTTDVSASGLRALALGMTWAETVRLPNSQQMVLEIGRRS